MGHVPVGDLKRTVIKPHNNHAFGKFTAPGVWHINVHVDKALVPAAKGYDPVVNLHVAVYRKATANASTFTTVSSERLTWTSVMVTGEEVSRRLLKRCGIL
jgi:hypothetical protein